MEASTPKGTGNHPYVFTLYALNVEKLDLGANTSLSTFQKALEGKIIGRQTSQGNMGARIWVLTEIIS